MRDSMSKGVLPIWPDFSRSSAEESDGQSIGGGIGSLTYVPAGSVVSWQAIAESRLLIFHFPGGFDRALAGGRGQDALVVAWLESMGTRFLTNMPLTPAALDEPE
jgi:hypothetical protein